MATYWSGDADVVWVNYAWSVLAEAGTVPKELDEDHIDYVDHLLTLVTLADLSNRFNEIVYGGSDNSHETVDLCGRGGRPWLSEVELGRYWERYGLVDDEYPETTGGLSEAAVTRLGPTVINQLVEQIGDSLLFATLWAQREPQVVGYPVSGEEFFHIVNSDLTFDKHDTYQWLT